jgi:pSer/pThr/pTyr-binding forkhead associated (FHA) protein
MPFIPFSTTNYKSSLSANNDDSSNSRAASHPRSRSHSQTYSHSHSGSHSGSHPGSHSNSSTNLHSSNINSNVANTNFVEGVNNHSNSNNSSNNSSTNSSPAIQQGTFQLKRKKSVGNAIFSLVNSIRPPNSAQTTSSRQGLRRESLSSQSRSRSASLSLSKQGSNNNVKNGTNGKETLFLKKNNDEYLNKARNEVEQANPFQTSLTPDLIHSFDYDNNGSPMNPAKYKTPNDRTVSLSNGMFAGSKDVNSNSNNNNHVSSLGFQSNHEDVESTTSSRLDPFNNIPNNNTNTSSNSEGGTEFLGNNNLTSYRVSPSPHILTNFNEINSEEVNRNREGNTHNASIIITNEDTSAHNTFNPSAYNYNLANSRTIANLGEYTDDMGHSRFGTTNLENNTIDNINTIIEVDDNDGNNTSTEFRTRGNTLREESNIYLPVAMSIDNNQTIGSAFNNPITIEDVNEDIVLIDIPLRDEDAIIIDREEDENVNTDNINYNNNIGPLSTGMNTVYHDLSTRIVNNATTSNTDNNNVNLSDCDSNGYFSIRLTPSIDHSSTHPYMFFGPIIRKLKPGMVIPIGRYTEKSKKAAIASSGSSEPVVFKSKVVSRKHAELTVNEEGKWYIKDIKSSSGTFLNHVRLSSANNESPNTLLKESDILQLGVDYRGGSEEIYRSVKVKIELNYSWKKRAAKFSKEAHEKLKQLTNVINGYSNNDDENKPNGNNQDLIPCVICLDDIKPCQAVFVSSCSHSWHYRCIRPLLVKTYPQFLCPNCKAVCDLEEDLDCANSDSD